MNFYDALLASTCRSAISRSTSCDPLLAGGSIHEPAGRAADADLGVAARSQGGAGQGRHREDRGLPWIPNAGPQTQAYFHPAKVLLYGGAGGGGKTDLSIGLAYTAHERSLMLRRKYADLGGLLDRAKQIHGSTNGFNRSPPPRLTFSRGDLGVHDRLRRQPAPRRRTKPAGQALRPQVH
jgi:hypothetical protein